MVIIITPNNDDMVAELVVSVVLTNILETLTQFGKIVR